MVKLFPEIEADLSIILKDRSETVGAKLGRVLKFDYEKCQHVMKDGRFVECSPVESVAQYIEHVLRTEMGKYEVYTVDSCDDFGISVYRFIGSKELPKDYFASELKREITQQLEQHIYIDEIESYEYSFSGRRLNVSFICRLISGETLSKDVIIYV